MKILTYNIRSWYRDTDSKQPTYWKKRAKQIRELIAEEAPDIILLQEALWPMRQRCIPKGYSKVKGFSISHHIYLKDSFAEVESRSWHIHYTTAKIRTKEAKRYVVASVHSTWKKDANKATCEAIYKLSRYNPNVIAGGDWNNPPEYEYKELFPLSIISTGLFTFQNWKTDNHANLDYFAVSNTDGTSVDYAQKATFSMSDHLPIILTL